MPMTATQILRHSTSREFPASYVKFKQVKIGRNRQTQVPTIKSMSYSTHTFLGERKNYQPNQYVSIVEIHGRYVVVGCSCDDFWAVWEVALSARGAARVEYSNGERPDNKNPKMVPGCCKHLHRLLSRLIEKGKL